jgi:hypothetical protein
MKKILYSVFITGAMLVAACSQEDKGTSTEVVNNDKEAVNPNNINDYDQPGTAGSGASTAYTDEYYQQEAQFVTDEMARDLQLDNATATELVKIYYKRNSQLGRNATAAESTSNNDRTSIDNMTDQEIKAILSPEQYKKYQQNRDKYNSMRMENHGNTGSTSTDRPVQREQ